MKQLSEEDIVWVLNNKHQLQWDEGDSRLNTRQWPTSLYHKDDTASLI